MERDRASQGSQVPWSRVARWCLLSTTLIVAFLTVRRPVRSQQEGTTRVVEQIISSSRENAIETRTADLALGRSGETETQVMTSTAPRANASANIPSRIPAGIRPSHSHRLPWLVDDANHVDETAVDDPFRIRDVLSVLRGQLYAKLSDPAACREPAIMRVGPMRPHAATKIEAFPKFRRSGDNSSIPLPETFLRSFGNDIGKGSPSSSSRLHPRLRPGAPATSLSRAGAMLSFTPAVDFVVLDIGTHVTADSFNQWWTSHPRCGFIWFEPQPAWSAVSMDKADDPSGPDFRRHMGVTMARAFGFPAAVSPNNTHVPFHVAADSACSSLLPMNGEAHGGDGNFRRCVSENNRSRIVVPTIRGEDVLSLVPPYLPIPFLAIDAQGFDLQVLASFSVERLSRIDVIVLECQDIDHRRLNQAALTVGVFTCSELQHCIEAALPHRMVSGATGQLGRRVCPANNPTDEHNCVFRRMDRPFFDSSHALLSKPHVVSTGERLIQHAPRSGLQCPAFASFTEAQ